MHITTLLLPATALFSVITAITAAPLPLADFRPVREPKERKEKIPLRDGGGGVALANGIISVVDGIEKDKFVRSS